MFSENIFFYTMKLQQILKRCCNLLEWLQHNSIGWAAFNNRRLVLTALTVVKAEESKVRVQRDPCLTGPPSVYRLVSSNYALMGRQR